MGPELTPRDAFLREMAAVQDEQLSHSQATEVARVRLHEHARGAGKPRPVLPFALAFAAAAAAALALFWSSKAPLSFAVGESTAAGALGAVVAAPQARSLDLSFSDGSVVALGPEAVARVVATDSHGAAVVLERGHAEVSVVPQRGTSWRVTAGPFEVQVKGTRFLLDWDQAREELDFRLLTGSVLITAPCLKGGRWLVAGQSLRASCRPATPVAAPLPPPISTTPVAEQVPAPPARADASAGLAPTPSWRQLASKQDYRAALAAAIREGYEQECQRASADDLLLLGDVARLGGDPQRATLAYTSARQKQPGLGRSAFALGLVEFNQGRYARAASWFSTYMREQPRGALREEAEGRLLEAWQRAGDRAQAKSAAQAYLARYPNGQHQSLAQRLIREP